MNTRILFLGAAILCFQGANLVAMEEKTDRSEYMKARQAYVLAKTDPMMSSEDKQSCQLNYKILKTRHLIKNLPWWIREGDLNMWMDAYVDSTKNKILKLEAREESVCTSQDNVTKIKNLKNTLEMAGIAWETGEGAIRAFMLKRLQGLSQSLTQLEKRKSSILQN